MSTKRVLVIAYDFPPRGGSGVQRTVKFAKYLPTFGWSVTVVCPDWRLKESRRGDSDLGAELPADVEVSYAGRPSVPRLTSLWDRLQRLPRGWAYVPKLRANCTFPDYASEWGSRALKTCHELLVRERFDAVYSTSPPATTHWIGLQLRKRYGLPWVVDLRDPWTDNPITQRHLWGWRNRLEEALEGKVYAEADLIIANTNTNRKDLLNRCRLDGSKVVVIPNGYDECDFDGISVSPPRHQFRIRYCGAARGDYNPASFLTAYREFMRVADPGTSIVSFAGTVCNWLRKHESSNWLAKNAELLGYVPHHEVPQLLQSSHVVLNINPPNSPECVPGKVYELLRCGRPILSICDSPSDVETLIAETQSGESFRHEDVEGIVAFLMRQYGEWKAGRSATAASRDQVAIARYERRHQTERLADLLNRLTTKSTGEGNSRQNGHASESQVTNYYGRTR